MSSRLKPLDEEMGMRRALVGSLPRWARPRYVLLVASVCVALPVAVSLLRASQFETTLEVFPTLPGNVVVGDASAPSDPNLVSNPGFEATTLEGWEDPPAFAVRVSSAEAHSGTDSLASSRDQLSSLDGNAGYTHVLFPGAGRYRVEAWVRLPRGYTGGPPGVYLEGFSGSRQVGRVEGDTSVRERWQRVSGEYTISANDLDGFVVFRIVAALPKRGQVVYWDDLFLPYRTTNLVVNPDFEHDTSGWADPPAFAVRRSDERAHSGIAALASSRDLPTPLDGNTGYSYLVFPGAGTYRVEAWVRLPRGYTGGRPAVYLEGFSGSTLRAQKLGNQRLRDRWQLVSSEYAISGQDLAGSLVLRTIDSLPRRDQVLYWDDVAVPLPLRAEAPDGRVAARQSRRLESLLADQQLRLDVALAAGKDLYRPDRVAVSQSRRTDALSFLVTAESDTPNDAQRLTDPLRTALVHAATRSRTQRAIERLDEITSGLEGKLGAGQRALLERRADDFRRLIAAQPPDFVVASSDSAADPDRLVDRILDKLPGAFPPRPHPVWVGAAGLLAALVVFGMAIAFTAVRRAGARR